MRHQSAAGMKTIFSEIGIANADDRQVKNKSKKTNKQKKPNISVWCMMKTVRGGLVD